MASIHRGIHVHVSPDVAWSAVRDYGAGHQRLFPGILTDVRVESDVRVATFANGMVLRERIVDVDDEARRFVYASVGGRASHHNSSLQVVPDGAHCRIVWITDVLPHELKESITQLVDAGIAVMKKTL